MEPRDTPDDAPQEAPHHHGPRAIRGSAHSFTVGHSSESGMSADSVSTAVVSYVYISISQQCMQFVFFGLLNYAMHRQFLILKF